jgi:hypothetical protein
MWTFMGSISVKSGDFQLWISYVAADTKMWFRKALGNFNISGGEWVSMKGSSIDHVVVKSVDSQRKQVTNN